MILVLAFTLTFAIVLGLSLTGGFGEFDGNLANIARAEEMSGGSDAGSLTSNQEFAIGSTADSFFGNSGELTAANFKFPGTDTTATTWTLTESLSTLALTATSHELYRTSSNATTVFSNLDTKGRIYIGIKDASAANGFMMAMRYEASSFMQNLLDIGYEIKATLKITTITATDNNTGFLPSNMTHDVYYGAVVTPKTSPKTAKEMYNDRTSSSFNKSSAKFNGADHSVANNVSTPEVTLTKTNNSITFGFGDDFTRRNSSLERSIKLTGLSIEFKIAYTEDVAKSTTIKDGGNPIKASEFFNTSTTDNTVYTGTYSSTKAYEYYNPYRTTTNASVTPGTQSHVWPLYYESIANDLKSAIDTKDANGNWTLNSYVSTTINANVGSGSTSTAYYKMASIDFADTYDYSYGASGSTNFDPSKYRTDANYRNVAGVGGYTYASGAWSADSNANSLGTKVASGINIVTVAAATQSGTAVEISEDVNKINASNSTSLGTGNMSARKAITVKEGNSTVTVGYLVVAKFNRARVRVSLYMIKNARVTIQISDNGNGSCSYTTDFKGIDTTEPTSDISLAYPAGNGAYVNNNIANIENVNTKWFRLNLFNPTTVTSKSEEVTDGTAAPYVWFYTVQRADTIKGLGDPYTFANYAAIKAQTAMQPIAYGEFTQFEYDFVNGGAKGYNSTTFNVPNPSIASVPTFQHTDAKGVPDYKPRGDGYYRFNFYIADAAGNLRANYVSSYYVKVDLSHPEASTNLSYTYDGEEHISITPKDFNNFQWNNSGNPILKWSTAETTFSIVLNNANFSGNTLLFYSGQKASTAHFLYFTREGMKSLSGQSVTGGAAVYDPETGTYKMRIKTDAGENDVYVSYSVRLLDANGNELDADAESYLIARHEATLTFEFEGANDEGEFPNVAWVSRFILYAGQYASAGDIENDSTLDIDKYSWYDAAWGQKRDGEVYILIDRNLPEKPELEVQNNLREYLVNDAEYNFDDIVRNWYTSYKLPVTMSTTDDIGNLADYGWGVRVYRGIKHITTRAELATLQAYNIEYNYRNINIDNVNKEYDGWFTNFNTFPYTDWKTNFDLDLLSGSQSGMRVIYLWMVDQAGQISELQTYYILTDDRTYNVTNSVFENTAFGVGTKEATIAQGKYVDEKVQPNVKTFSRGETVHFTFSLTEGGGYVPFLFKMNGVPVFENYSQLKDISAVDDDGNSLAAVLETPYRAGKDGSDTYIVTYRIDSADSLARLDANIEFELSDRFVVTYVYGVNSVMYSADYANITVMELNEPKALDHFQYVFVDNDNRVLYATTKGGYTADLEDENILIENDEPVLFRAINAGEYKVRIFIPKDDDTYVTSDYDFNAETGEQIFNPYTFYIEQCVVTITPIATESVFGDDIILDWDYTVPNGVDVTKEGEKLVGSLRLRTPTGVNWAVNALLDVGSYEIIQNEDDPFKVNDNFRITFIPAIFHQITAREVNIVAWNDTKSYGDVKDDFLFGVDTAQFGWFTRRGGGHNVDAVLELVFKNYKADTSVTEAGYKFYKAGDLISCSADRYSNVGDYPFIADENAFMANGKNYTITINVEGKNLTITQRTVGLDVSGQFTVVGQGTQINTAAVRPTFSIDPNDEHLRTQINERVAGNITISNVKHTETTWPDEYSGMEWYEILLGDFDTDNIHFKLVGDVRYVVYFAGTNSILIGIKEGASFTLPFGTTYTSDLITFGKFASNFVVQNIEADEYDRIEWDFAIANASLNGIISTGGHQVTISNIRVYKNNTLLDRRAFADSFNLTITPSTILVRPAVNPAEGYNAMHKTYGDAESAFGFDFEITGIRMGDTIVPITSSSTFAGYTYAQLRAAIRGAYVRALYAQDGTYKRRGYVNDSVTDANGFVMDATGATTDYYSFRVGTAFNSTDSNFNVEEEQVVNDRLFIDRKALSLELANFIGVNKTYDGNTDVNFGTALVYDLSNQMISTSDSVTLKFTAKYTEEGSLNELKEVGIIFSDFSIEGTNVFNYVLGTVSNKANPSNEGELYNAEGALVEEVTVANGVYLIIYYTENDGEISEELHIRIYTGKVGLTQNDFEISKVYDNTTSLTLDNVTFFECEADSDGYSSKVIYNIWNEGKAQIIGGAAFRAADAATYSIGLIRFFFPLEGADGLDINTKGKYDPATSRITVYADSLNGVEGVFVEIKNIVATITPRIITADSFEEINIIDRDYNGTARVATDVIPKDNVFAAGDTKDSVGLRLVAYISDGDPSQENYIRYGHGEHTVSFAAYSDKTQADAPDNTTIRNKNYSIDIDGLNELYSGENALKVQISKAKLTPDVTFKDKNYDGSTKVPTEDDKNKLTVIGSATSLANELATFSLQNKLSYVLSAYGNPDANVAVDEDGQVTAHNVKVSGMTILENSGKNYLRNYEINGYFYQNDKYVPVGEVIEKLESGASIDDYEILGALTVNKKAILIRANNVTIEEKIYDGTRNANVSISLENSGVVEGHEKHLTITASGLFARNVVADNVPVSIFDVVLVSLDKEGDEYYNNYLLSDYTASRTASILPRPVAVTADLGEKVYNGLAAISNSQMSFTIEGILDSEVSGYAVQASNGAYFWDKDVEVATDDDGNVTDILSKRGTVYNPILRNNRGKVNYTPVVASKTLNGTYIGYVDAEGVLHYGQGDQAVEGDVTYYYALPVADKYITIRNSNADMIAAAQDYIAGYYSLNGTRVYVVDSSYGGDVTGTLSTPLAYIQGEGRILQRNIAIASSGIVVNPNSTAFTKMYDGTSKFLGNRYDEEKPEAEWDYRYAKGSILGVIEGDDVDISGIDAKFDSADSTANYVIFTPTGIEGNDVHNYCISGEIASARIRGKITKRPINAELLDGTMEYGTPLGSVVGEIVYTVQGNDEYFELDLWEDGFFLSFTNYTKMLGVDVGDFQDPIMTRLYVKNTAGGYDRVPTEEYNEDAINENPDSYFIRLTGITGFPTAKAEFPSALPSAGSQATRYTLNVVTVNNYAYNPVYTKGDTSVLTVTRKDIFVATDGNEYVMKYGEGNPQIDTYYVDKNGNPGFVSPDNAITVFRVGSKDYYPVIKYGIYDEVTNEVTDIDKYPVLSAELPSTQRYIVYFEKPAGVDYETLIPNYTIHLGDSYEITDAGVLVIKYCETELKTGVSVINLELPEIAGLSLRGAQDETFNVTYDGSNLASTAIIGALREGDKIYVDNGEEMIEPIDAGTYTGIVKVFRPIAIDAGDPHGYEAIWQGGNTVTIIVDKASPSLNVIGGSKTYNGKAFEYSLDGGLIGYKQGDSLTILEEYAEISYEMLVDGSYVAVKEMKNAGVYRVTVALNDKFAEDSRNRNYMPETATAQYTIMRAVVNVNIIEGDYKLTNSNGEYVLDTAYVEGKEYVINYTMYMAAGVPEEIKLAKENTHIVFAKDIASPGMYKFDVEIIESSDNRFDKNNYNIVGAKGTLALTTVFVQTVNGASSVQLSDAVVANRFVAQEIINGSGSAYDLDYWQKVESYMPRIGGNASLAAVVKTTLYYGKTVVDIEGSSVDVSVALPVEVSDMDGIAVYIVTREGGLKLLSDYTINNGKIEYKTDYLGAVVFVDISAAKLPLWAIITLSVTGGILGVSLIWAGIALIIRKRRLQTL